MKKSRVLRNIAFLLLFFCVLYLAYDRYFRLPALVDENSGPQSPIIAELPKFNILLLGLDGRKGVNDRTDTIMLVSIDEEKKAAHILSIPRDTRVKVKGAYDKINAAYAYGGLELTKKTVEDFLGVTIDRYAVVNFTGLIKAVDQVGGLDVDVPVRMYVPLEGIDLQKGKQHLDGEQVLAYSRFRYTEGGDIDRVKRQQEVIHLLADKMFSPVNLPKIPQYITILQEDVDTDLSTKELIALARIAPSILDNGLNGEVLPGDNKKIDDLWYWEPDMSALKK